MIIMCVCVCVCTFLGVEDVILFVNDEVIESILETDLAPIERIENVIDEQEPLLIENEATQAILELELIDGMIEFDETTRDRLTHREVSVGERVTYSIVAEHDTELGRIVQRQLVRGARVNETHRGQDKLFVETV